jgi:light-regulated signal transduction histidine kinase (bacteriophytochrome)
MRFPASDIPVQARRLYTINTLRLIADVHDAPVLSRATAMRSGEIEAARTRLLAMLGHDLRDPLQTISVVGQLMVRSADARLGQRITNRPAACSGLTRRCRMSAVCRVGSGSACSSHRSI